MAAKLAISCFLLLSMAMSSAMAAEYSFASNLNPKVLRLKKEKLTHLHLYWHDVVGGNKPTSIAVLPGLSNTTLFGLVNMFDNPLTVGPHPKSQLVGRSQGLYASAAQTEIGLLMAMNFVFTSGKYNGSSIAILGHNPILNTVREMPVVGGSGRFRFARGYAQARTQFFNATSLDAVVEYNIYVLHY
ncbi:dirigent protein 22-like [Cucurbita moschata]|uniref:Dirigent protein n=1 Tax=Cucurbita moschata TaxID=3662 RepID=A0A6J1H1K7_CUCMO|nr:dirigent protein 22-like [Cucurbita moschata]